MRNKLNVTLLNEIQNEFVKEVQIGQTVGTSNCFYLRFGYWEQVDVAKLNELLEPLNTVQEDAWYDDDCGWLYNYHFL